MSVEPYAVAQKSDRMPKIILAGLSTCSSRLLHCDPRPQERGMTMITKEQALELLSSIADNPPRVCVAWCGKAKDDCACFKAHVAREAVNGQAEDALQTVIALHERVERLEAALREIAKPYPADQDRLIHSQQQIASIARAALKGDDHE